MKLIGWFLILHVMKGTGDPVEVQEMCTSLLSRTDTVIFCPPVREVLGLSKRKFKYQHINLKAETIIFMTVFQEVKINNGPTKFSLNSMD